VEIVSGDESAVMRSEGMPKRSEAKLRTCSNTGAVNFVLQ